MILKYDAYTEVFEEQERKEQEIQNLKESLNKEMVILKEQITKDVRKQISELFIRIKPEIIREGMSP
jgi:F0F1-type ATP synthase membrane subunit b/b'